MKRAFLLLCLLVGLLFGIQAQAEPTNCDGDETPEQIEAREIIGSHPLAKGVFLIFDTCVQAKKFLTALSNLGVSKRAGSVSSEQVRGALEGMATGQGSVSSCLWNFDAVACKRYLGIGDSASAAPTSSPSPTRPASTPLTLARAKIKKDEVILKDRELAANLVAICKSVMSEGACETRLHEIERLRDDVARMNQDPELMAFIPPITLDSPDLIVQTGWERGAGGGAWYNRAGNKVNRECPELTTLINGLVANAPERARARIPEFKKTCAERDPSYAEWLQRWETQLGGASTKIGSKGAAYVRPEDCTRLSKQIDADLRARPNEEPPSLSFFEVECVGDASGKYAGQVASWKQTIASRKATDALNQWDDGVRQVEIEQKKAKEEEERRVVAQRKREQDEAAAGHLANVSTSRVGVTREAGAVTRTDCTAERAAYIDAQRLESPNDNHDREADKQIGYANATRSKSDGEAAIAFSRSQMEEAQKMLRWHSENPNKFVVWSNPNMNRRDIAKSNYHICLTETRLRQMAGDSRSLASEEPALVACEAAIKKAENEIASAPSPQQGAMAALQYAMWANKKVIAALDTYCPRTGKYIAKRESLQKAYDTAATGCSQIKSGGGGCTPQQN